MLDLYSNLLAERASSINELEHCKDAVSKTAEAIASAFDRGRKLLVCGNGGSAADAQHMVAEFVGRFLEDRPGLPAIALTTNSSALTAIGNDWSYDYVFRRQLEALGQPGDVFLGITTSGKSSNVLDALAHARTMGLVSIGLTGRDGGRVKAATDITINVGGDKTPVIQERQLTVEHIICEMVDARLSELKRRPHEAKGRTYYIDIDGTICMTPSGDYRLAQPIVDRIDRVNRLYDAGNTIIFYTARGSVSGIDWRPLTRDQLGKWGVKYHELRMGKAQYDLWVDDKAVNDVDFFSPTEE